jgi:hypothetical protein
LTKDQVATDNSGGGNWGASCYGDIHQIKTIAAAPTVANETTSNSSTHQVVLQTLPASMPRQINGLSLWKEAIVNTG